MVMGQSYDFYVDHWCLGILCYEFLTGQPPFLSGTTQETYAKIKTITIQWPKQIKPAAKDLISKVPFVFYISLYQNTHDKNFLFIKMYFAVDQEKKFGANFLG